ncbi:Ankyrin repeat [Ostreococcus tauri]|uniref:Ankyrin repeat n=1 Tax=Ostreococcus tauri TaxID=70448 RepID=A0A090LXJ3_OSTTA|nr:Ankyrin repeat [Ostreococcus tauri]CEF96526.1 Ankyrin repeat [Ostreococcus tauri]|eukprot:XP_022838143.1 Ankyrin repeat [Ostreococcus tauri]
MSKDEIRSVFAFLVTRADDVTGEYDVDYDTFASEVEPRTRRDEEMKEAYALCDELIGCGAVAAQILEILNNPNIEAFSDETDWVGADEWAAMRDTRAESGRGVGTASDFAREAQLISAGIRACRLNRPRDIERLVDDEGLDVDARDETNEGQTLLMISAANGNKAACKKLLILGAMPDALDTLGRTAVDVAAKYNHFALAEYLQTHGVPLGSDGADGVTHSKENYEPFSESSRHESPGPGKSASYRDNDDDDDDDDDDGDGEFASPSAPPMDVDAALAVDERRAVDYQSPLLTPD